MEASDRGCTWLPPTPVPTTRPIDGVIVTKLAYGTAYLQPGAASRVAARHEPGARVKTPYGDAQVLQSREADGSYVVELTKWTLAEPADVNAPRRRPLAYLQVSGARGRCALGRAQRALSPVSALARLTRTLPAPKPCAAPRLCGK